MTIIGNLIAKIGPSSALSEQFPPSPTYDPTKDIPDLTGKVILVTGGNGGIGYNTIKYLLLKDAKVYLACRTVAKGEEAIKNLEKETNGKTAILLKLDLADLKSVRTAAEEFLSKEERLDVLFNNAGVMVPPMDQLTAQGYDLQFGTNVLGHYFLTKLLLPALKRSTTHHGTKARVVNTSSYVHHLAPGPTGIDWTALKGGDARDATIKSWGMLSNWRLYGASKIGNVLISNLLVRQHSEDVMSCALHPGGLRTDLQRHMLTWRHWLVNLILHPAHLGSYTQLWAGTSADGAAFDGKYLIPWARTGKANPRAANEKTQDELQKWLDDQISGF